MFDYEEFLQTIRKGLNDKFNSVAIVGHEPSISDTLRALVGSSRPNLEKILNLFNLSTLQPDICLF